eukprot:m.352688 g.352688  ORF g.352688 m.352688 type:complete len:63 (-) comp16585_c0_seq1:384-572(-)
MSVGNFLHKAVVTGLVGVTLYYSVFIVSSSSEVVQRYQEAKAAKASEAVAARNAIDQASQQQ